LPLLAAERPRRRVGHLRCARADQACHRFAQRHLRVESHRPPAFGTALGVAEAAGGNTLGLRPQSCMQVQPDAGRGIRHDARQRTPVPPQIPAPAALHPTGAARGGPVIGVVESSVHGRKHTIYGRTD